MAPSDAQSHPPDPHAGALSAPTGAVRSMILALVVLELIALPSSLLGAEQLSSRLIAIAINLLVIGATLSAYRMLRTGSIERSVVVAAGSMQIGLLLRVGLAQITAPGLLFAIAVTIVLVGMLASRRALIFAVIGGCITIGIAAIVQAGRPPQGLLSSAMEQLVGSVALGVIGSAALGFLVDQARTILTQSSDELRRTNEQLALALAERQRSDSALARIESRHQMIVENSHDLILILDTSGTIVFANAAVEQILGCAPSELIGSSALERVHPDDLAMIGILWQRAMVEPVTHTGVRYRHNSGSYRWIDSRTSLVDHNGQMMVVSLGRDITEQRQLTEQLMHAQKMEGLGRLAGGVAHDFNNLLVVISGYADLARASIAPDHPAQIDLADIRDATERGRALTKQLLTFARRHNFTPQPVDLNVVVVDMQRMLRRLIRRDVELVIATDSALGTIKGDPDQIAQVMINLVANACDAIVGAGTITISTGLCQLSEADNLRIANTRPGTYAMLSISDTGIGMDAHTLEHVFEPFFTTKEPGQGTGLGMAICYGIISQHGGAIDISSTVGSGTRITIYLPQTEDLLAPTTSVV